MIDCYFCDFAVASGKFDGAFDVIIFDNQSYFSLQLQIKYFYF